MLQRERERERERDSTLLLLLLLTKVHVECKSILSLYSIYDSRVESEDEEAREVEEEKEKKEDYCFILDIFFLFCLLASSSPLFHFHSLSLSLSLYLVRGCISVVLAVERIIHKRDKKGGQSSSVSLKREKISSAFTLCVLFAGWFHFFSSFLMLWHSSHQMHLSLSPQLLLYFCSTHLRCSRSFFFSLFSSSESERQEEMGGRYEMQIQERRMKKKYSL